MEDAGHAGLKSEVFLSHFIVKVTETASNLFSMLHATIIQPWFNGPHAGVKKSSSLLVVSQEYLSIGSAYVKLWVTQAS